MRTVCSCLGLALLAAGCAGRSVEGSGKVISQSRTVSGFTSISLSGSGELLLEQGDRESLLVTTDDNLLTYVTSEVSGTDLQLGEKRTVTLRPSKGISYRVTVKRLEGLTLSGSGLVDAKRIDAGRLQIVLSGSGNMTLAGKAEGQEVTISGSGNYRGQDLKSKTATITLSGSGNALLDVSHTLDATLSGSGLIEYLGDPDVTQKVSGSGTVRKHLRQQ